MQGQIIMLFLFTTGNLNSLHFVDQVGMSVNFFENNLGLFRLRSVQPGILLLVVSIDGLLFYIKETRTSAGVFEVVQLIYSISRNFIFTIFS
jgi:hypothetical protein